MVSGNGMYKKNNSKNGKRSNSEDEQQFYRKESANETISVNQEAARFAKPRHCLVEPAPPFRKSRNLGWAKRGGLRFRV